MNQKRLDEQRRGGGKEGRREGGEGWALDRDQAGEEEVTRQEQTEIVTKACHLLFSNRQYLHAAASFCSTGKGTVQTAILWGEMY